jgi:hypothetical protein
MMPWFGVLAKGRALLGSRQGMLSLPLGLI